MHGSIANCFFGGSTEIIHVRQSSGGGRKRRGKPQVGIAECFVLVQSNGVHTHGKGARPRKHLAAAVADGCGRGTRDAGEEQCDSIWH